MKNTSSDMHKITELPGEYFDDDTQQIIYARYKFAQKYIRNKVVLEIGAGAGWGLDAFLPMAEKLFVSEYSDENIDLLRSRTSTLNSEIILLDANQIDELEHKFDIIIALAMIYYIDFEDFLIKAKKVLKKGGRLVFCQSNPCVTGFEKPPHTGKYYNNLELEALLLKTGYRCEIYGNFEKFNGNLFMIKCLGRVKNVIKHFVKNIPFGLIFWNKFKRRTQKNVAPLPKSFSDFNGSIPNFTKLSGKIDQVHRVIYVSATLCEGKHYEN